MAQGILESSSGKGELALKSNNHFGIKCHSTWKGKKVYHDDDEKGECFRKYRNPETSYRDHSLFLKSRSRYGFLFKSQVGGDNLSGFNKAGLIIGVYANKLISIIERYELWKLDGSKKPLNKSKEKRVSKKESNKDSNSIVRQVGNHLVKKGDTLFSISKKYNISVSDLIKINNLIGNNRKLQGLKTKK